MTDEPAEKPRLGRLLAGGGVDYSKHPGDELPDEPFSFVGSPTERRRITMPKVTTQPFKAAFAFVVTFIGAILVFVQDKTEFSDLTLLQWLIVLGFALVNTAGVYQITNPPTVRGGRRNDVGQSVLYIAVVVVVILAAIWLLSLLVR